MRPRLNDLTPVFGLYRLCNADLWNIYTAAHRSTLAPWLPAFNPDIVASYKDYHHHGCIIDPDERRSRLLFEELPANNLRWWRFPSVDGVRHRHTLTFISNRSTGHRMYRARWGQSFKSICQLLEDDEYLVVKEILCHKKARTLAVYTMTNRANPEMANAQLRDLAT